MWSFATSWFADRGWSPAMVWTIAVVTALLLFASVLLHELAHSLVGRAQGIRVRSISLFLLGGVATFDDEARSPGREAVMAVAGPATSAVIAGLTWFAAGLVSEPDQLYSMLVALWWINTVLTVFNLLPGLPLDGGRVLRALVWKLTGDRARATRIAARIGLTVGWLLVGGGLLLAFNGDIAGGLWTAFIGWTMVQAARATAIQSRSAGPLAGSFAGATVAQLMTPAHGWAPGSVDLVAAASEYFGPFAARYLPVVDDGGRLEGVAALEALVSVAPELRPTTTLRAVMVPFDELALVAPQAPADEAIERLRSGVARRLVVVDGDRLVGFLDHADVTRFVEASAGGA